MNRRKALEQIEARVFGSNKFIVRRLPFNPFIIPDYSRRPKIELPPVVDDDVDEHLEVAISYKTKVSAVLWGIVERELGLVLAARDVKDSASEHLSCDANMDKIVKAVTTSIELNGISEVMSVLQVDKAIAERVLSTITPNINLPDLVARLNEKLRRV